MKKELQTVKGKPLRKARRFHATGQILTISDDFRSFGIECSREDIKGLLTPKTDKIKLSINVSYENSILLRHWIKVGDTVYLDLVYLVFYEGNGDETSSKIYFKNFLK
jgi:hypothetical protein